MKTAIVIDSGSNIYSENISLDGIFSIPLQIIEGDKAFQEGLEISTQDVNSKMKQKVMLQTSLPVLGKIELLFSEIKDQGYDQIFAVPITSGLSGTIGAMQSAAQIANIPFDYIDCFTTMHIQLFTALRAYRLFNEGLNNNEVKTALKEFIAESNTFIIPDNLEHLARGGRLSPLAAKLGGLLRIKPILYLDESTGGVIEPLEKVRTMSKALDHVIDNMKKAGVDENYQITFTHVDAGNDAMKALEKLKEAFPDTKILKRDLISTVSVHVGLGAIALQYMKKTSL